MVLKLDDFLKLRQSQPLIDVRSEKEFSEGHIAFAKNVPILTNAERAEVGIDYKQKGSLEAIKTGFRLVGPRFLEIINRSEFEADGKELLAYCWRGGMRSANYAQILGMAKLTCHTLEGGYKTYRDEALTRFAMPYKLRVIAGFTGSGKSDVLRALRDAGEQIIDFEKLANHRGSAFGGLMMPPQPSTEQFQNAIFEQLLIIDPERPIWVEDESISIGKVFLPEQLWRQMLAAPVFDISLPKEVRIRRLVEEYGEADRSEFMEAMINITKKLGGQNFNEASRRLTANDMAGTIDILLYYYDKAYQTGLRQKKDRIRAQISWNGTDPAECARQLVNEKL